MFLKRSFDIVLSAMGIFFSLPFSVAAGFLVWISDWGPIFYFQSRIGKDGREFRIIKFRSMIKDAEKNTGVVFACKDDPRITKIGKILRATAIDEILQLLSIFKGDMSFVGPRPERPELVKKFCETIPDYALRHRVKPGLTGMAQVFGEYNTLPQEKLEYDILYKDKKSFWFDLHLVLVSFWITFRGKWGMG